MNTVGIIPELDFISKGFIEPVLRLVTGERWALAKDKFTVKVVLERFDVLLFQNTIQSKGSPAGEAHQDISTSDNDPNSDKFFNSKRTITVNIPIDKSSVENACLRLAVNYKKAKFHLSSNK